MSVDRSLKSRSALSRHRNVLTRTERIEKLADDGLWTEEGNSVFGLPKVTNRKTSAGKKAKTPKEQAAEETTETTEGQAASQEA